MIAMSVRDDEKSPITVKKLPSSKTDVFVSILKNSLEKLVRIFLKVILEIHSSQFIQILWNSSGFFGIP
jgi:hypothetical protein